MNTVLFTSMQTKTPCKSACLGRHLKEGKNRDLYFEGIMDRFLFTEILERTLVPFVESKFPDSHCFMQDNDPKHTSNYAKDFIINNGINWWKTPAESPDLNPIENLWHELKEMSRREVKPRTKQELIDGILKFW